MNTSTSIRAPAPKNMELSLGIPVIFGDRHGTVYGGPFRQYVPGTRRLVGIKMAVEIDHPHDFKVDTADFSVPTMDAMHQGIEFALLSLFKGKDVYVGCMGGIGRTGLFMGCMAKVMRDYRQTLYKVQMEGHDPVKYVRHHFKPHAIETDEQQDFVRDFDTDPHVLWLQEQFRPKVVEKEVFKTVFKEVESIVFVDKEVLVYLTPLQAFMRWFKQ